MCHLIKFDYIRRDGLIPNSNYQTATFLQLIKFGNVCWDGAI